VPPPVDAVVVPAPSSSPQAMNASAPESKSTAAIVEVERMSATFLR
jgi:hypothetical protein